MLDLGGVIIYYLSWCRSVSFRSRSLFFPSFAGGNGGVLLEVGTGRGVGSWRVLFLEFVAVLVVKEVLGTAAVTR